MHLLDRCEKVCYTNEVFYHYMRRVDGSSITTAAFSEKKTAWVKHCRDNLAFIRERYMELEGAATARYCSSILWILREICLQETGFEKEWRLLRSELRQSFRLFWKIASLRDKVLMLLLGYSPRFCAYELLKKRSKA